MKNFILLSAIFGCLIGLLFSSINNFNESKPISIKHTDKLEKITHWRYRSTYELFLINSFNEIYIIEINEPKRAVGSIIGNRIKIDCPKNKDNWVDFYTDGSIHIHIKSIEDIR